MNFCMVHELQRVPAYFNGWKKKTQRKNNVLAIWKLCEFPMSASINKVLLEHSSALWFLPTTASTLEGQVGQMGQRPCGPQSQKIDCLPLYGQIYYLLTPALASV